MPTTTVSKYIADLMYLFAVAGIPVAFLSAASNR